MQRTGTAVTALRYGNGRLDMQGKKTFFTHARLCLRCALQGLRPLNDRSWTKWRYHDLSKMKVDCDACGLLFRRALWARRRSLVCVRMVWPHGLQCGAPLLRGGRPPNRILGEMAFVDVWE